MLATIHLNDQFFTWSTKIHNVFSNSMLPAEVDIFEAMRA
jgi:hypothetical protein